MVFQSISTLRSALQTHITGYHKHRHNKKIVRDIWNKLLQDRGMPKRQHITRKSGGASYSLLGAPLNYAMTPGSDFTTDPAVAVYERFPIDPTVNPQVVSDLDVFFGSALSRGCGVEDTSLKVPADMGSNKVGGKRRNRTRTRKYGGASNNLMPGFGSKIADFGTTVANHPYMASAYPNIAQSLTNSWQGKLDQIPSSSDPTDHTWKYSSEFPLPAANPMKMATSLGPSPYLMQQSALSFNNSTSGSASTGTDTTPSPSPATGGARRYRKSRKSNKYRKARKSLKRRN